MSATNPSEDLRYGLTNAPGADETVLFLQEVAVSWEPCYKEESVLTTQTLTNFKGGSKSAYTQEVDVFVVSW